LPQMSKAEHFLRENEFVPFDFALIDAIARLKQIWRIRACGCALLCRAIRRL
jgi:hypothetical protein